MAKDNILPVIEQPTTGYRIFKDKMKKIKPKDIKEYRNKNGLSQEQLGRMLGVTQITVSRWESGTVNPTGSAAMMLKILLYGKDEVQTYKNNATTNQKSGPWGAVLGAGITMVSGYALYLLLKDIFSALEEEEEEEDDDDDDDK